MSRDMSRDFLDEYLSGDCVGVWDELTTLGDLHDDEVRISVVAIAQEMMHRVRTNIKVLVERWQSLGFRFGDGFLGDLDEKTRQEMLDDASVYGFSDTQQDLFHEEIARLERLTGGLPIALHSFYEVVGSVNFIGAGPIWREDDPPRPGDSPLVRYELSRYGSDPLFVWSPKVALILYPELEQASIGSTPSPEHAAPFPVDIAPDFYYKFGVGGSDPYQIRVPCWAADAPLDYEWHHTTFVKYLRICCHWGGFPGLEYHRDKDRLTSVIQDLTHDLVPF